MALPSYVLPRPPLDLSQATLAGFARVYAEAVRPGDGQALDRAAVAPVWQFLCWLCDTHDGVLHGSGDPSIRGAAFSRPCRPCLARRS